MDLYSAVKAMVWDRSKISVIPFVGFASIGERGMPALPRREENERAPMFALSVFADPESRLSPPLCIVRCFEKRIPNASSFKMDVDGIA